MIKIDPFLSGQENMASKHYIFYNSHILFLNTLHLQYPFFFHRSRSTLKRVHQPTLSDEETDTYSFASRQYDLVDRTQGSGSGALDSVYSFAPDSSTH